MILCIPDALSEELRHEVVDALARGKFVNGRATADEQAGLVKNNLQLDESDSVHAELSRLVSGAVFANSLFQLAVYPKTLLPFRFSRYDPGMGYGPHVDEPFFEDNRSDVSMTLFLSNPESYRGGELVIEWGGVEEAFKLAAGSMVIYPSTTLHRVEAVTEGTRLAAVSWSQSRIRDPAKRELIFELDLARRSLYQSHGKTTEFDTLSKSVANLLRMWADS